MSTFREEKLFEIKVTQVKIFEPFVMITVQQPNKHYSKLNQLQDLFETTDYVDPSIGDFCIARVGPKQYERCRATHVNFGIVTVSFIDCGYFGDLPIGLVRVVRDPHLENIQSLCNEYILSGVVIDVSEDCDLRQTLKPLHTMMINSKFTMEVIEESEDGKFVKLQQGIDGSVINDLILNDPVLSTVLKPIAIDRQTKMLYDKMKQFENLVKVQGLKFNSLLLSPKTPAVPSVQEVKITSTHAYSPPFKVYVRKVARDAEYQKFQRKLQTVTKENLPHQRLRAANTKCLVMINNELHRGEKLSDDQYHPSGNVQLIDSGEFDDADNENIFKMPNTVANEPPFAEAFVLAGPEDENLKNLSKHEFDTYLKYVTQDKVLKLKTVTDDGEFPTCQLFDENDANILDIIHEWNTRGMQFSQQPKLHRNDVYRVKVRSVNSPSDFHVTLPDAKLDEIERSLKYVDSPTLKYPEAGEICVVQPTSYPDSLSFRGLIKRHYSPYEYFNESFENCSPIINVKAVDYGFTDCFITEKILTIPKDFRQTPPLAYRFSLQDVDNKSEYSEQELCEFKNKCKTNAELLVRVVNFVESKDCYVVELVDSSDDDQMSSNSDWNEPIVKSSWCMESRWSSDFSLSEEHKFIRISALVSPTNFTIQKLSEIDEFNRFRKEIQSIAKDQATLTRIDVGQFCLTLNTSSGLWCRAVITDVGNESFSVTVKNVDDGTTFTVCDEKNLKTIPLQLVLMKYFGMDCSLPMRLNPKREAEASDYLSQLTLLTYELIAMQDNINYIELFSDGVNVADELVKKKLAKRIMIAPSGKAKITHVESLKNFYIQMESNIERLHQIVEYCDSYTHCEVDRLQIGMLVLGFFKKDKTWYRARLQSINKNNYDVFFVDYGFSGVVDEIGCIVNKEISMICPIAIKCSLLPPEDSQIIGSDIIRKFKALAKDANKLMTVSLLKPYDDFAHVELVDEGVNVLQKLLLKRPSMCSFFDCGSDRS